MPILIVDYDRLFTRYYLVALLKDSTCLLGNLFVEFFAVAVVLVDVFALLIGIGNVFSHQQIHGFASALHTA